MKRTLAVFRCWECQHGRLDAVGTAPYVVTQVFCARRERHLDSDDTGVGRCSGFQTTEQKTTP